MSAEDWIPFDDFDEVADFLGDEDPDYQSFPLYHGRAPGRTSAAIRFSPSVRSFRHFRVLSTGETEGSDDGRHWFPVHIKVAGIDRLKAWGGPVVNTITDAVAARHMAEIARQTAARIANEPLFSTLPWEPAKCDRYTHVSPPSPQQEPIMANRNPNTAAHFSGKVPFFVIFNPTSDRPITQTFDTAEEAWDIADEMSRKNDGQRFFVLKSVGSSAVEKPITRRTYTTNPTEDLKAEGGEA